MLCVRVVLGLHIARFAAGAAVVLAVFAQADVKLGAAKPAIFRAGAALLNLVALRADEILRHEAEINPNRAGEQITNGALATQSQAYASCDKAAGFVDPCKTRMLTLKVPRAPAKRSVR